MGNGRCEHRRVWLAGIPVSALSLPGALEQLDGLIHDGQSHYVCFLEGNLLAHADKEPRLREVLCQSSAVFPDGVVLMVLGRLLRSPLPERITGPRFLLAACEYGLDKGYRHFFYGGRPGVAERLAHRLSERFPGLEVAGTYSPPFRPLADDEEQRIKEKIEATRSHLLWVALGGPKQEFWVAEHAGKINVPVMLAVGAAFDFHSGSVPWAPRWIRAMGMEWAYRAVTGGRRVFLRNSRCVCVAVLVVIRELIRQRLLRRRRK